MSDGPDTLAAFPFSLGAEKAVLSVLLQDPAMIDEVPAITPQHFHIPAHRELFEIIQEMTVAGHPIELVSFIQMLLDRGKLDRIGGPSALTDIYTYQPTPTHLKNHAAILSEKLARRMTIAAAAEMHRLAFEAEDAAEIIEATSAPISAIHDTLTATRPARSTKAVLSACIDRFQQLCAGHADPMGIETSLFEINRRFRGLHPKQTIVISGYPGAGKTTLAAQLAMDCALSENNTLICSLEMPEETMMNRLLAYVARRPGDSITDPTRYAREVLDAKVPTKDMLRSIQTASLKIGACPLAIEDLIGANVHQIASCIRRAHRKKPLAVAVVDFAQRIRSVPEMRRESREQQLAHASNHLADLSKELGFCLLLPSQLNKDGGAKHAEAINEDSDLHLQIVQDRSGQTPTYAHQLTHPMKAPPFQFPTDRITHLLPSPEMADFAIHRAIAVPSATPGVHYIGIINDAAKHWRFVRGPSAVHSGKIWRWLAAVNPHWLKAGFGFQENANFRATNPDAVLERFKNMTSPRGTVFFCDWIL